MQNTTDKKVVMVGDAGVGKSMFISCYLNDCGQMPCPTVGVQRKLVDVTVDAECVPISLYDTAGQERYRSLTVSYLRDSDGVFCVFDVTREQSFESIDAWISMIRDRCISDVPIILLANKIDLCRGSNPLEKKYMEYAKMNGLELVETSAIEGTGVRRAMYLMATKVKQVNKPTTTNPVIDKKPCSC